MTEKEIMACNQYLDDIDKTQTCNEYRLLKEMLNSQIPSPESKKLRAVSMIGVFIFGLCLHINCMRALQSGRYVIAIYDYGFGLFFLALAISFIYGEYLRKPFTRWLMRMKHKNIP